MGTQRTGAFTLAVAVIVAMMFVHLLLVALRDWYLQERLALDTAIKGATDEALRVAVSNVPPPPDPRREEEVARLELLRSQLLSHVDKGAGISVSRMSSWVNSAEELLELVKPTASQGFRGGSYDPNDFPECVASLRKVAISLKVEDLV